MFAHGAAPPALRWRAGLPPSRSSPPPSPKFPAALRPLNARLPARCLVEPEIPSGRRAHADVAATPRTRSSTQPGAGRPTWWSPISTTGPSSALMLRDALGPPRRAVVRASWATPRHPGPAHPGPWPSLASPPPKIARRCTGRSSHQHTGATIHPGSKWKNKPAEIAIRQRLAGLIAPRTQRPGPGGVSAFLGRAGRGRVHLPRRAGPGGRQARNPGPASLVPGS